MIEISVSVSQSNKCGHSKKKCLAGSTAENNRFGSYRFKNMLVLRTPILMDLLSVCYILMSITVPRTIHKLFISSVARSYSHTIQLIYELLDY